MIDAGFSAKAISQKLSLLNVDISEIDAILVTHEHTDHIQGLKVLALKHHIPVLANHGTARGIVEYLGECPKFKIFSTGETFNFQDLTIHPFSIQHDTLDPVAFTIQVDGLKLGFCTDLGYSTTLVQSHLKLCDYMMIEANHQPSMVHMSARPMVYKQRVLSRTGHLSNQDCGQLLASVAHDGLKHVHLAHLSSECNTHDTALSVVKGILQDHGIFLNMCVAPQDKICQFVTF